MAKPKLLVEVKLIAGLFFNDLAAYNKAKQELIKAFGDIDFESEEYDFTDFTNYYETEIGKTLKKRIISFERLIDRNDLADIKEKSNKIEDALAQDNKRKVNIDTGYLTSHNIILASAKEMPHKVSIGKGFFGDVVLTYRNGEYHDYFRTFPDHKSDNVKRIYKRIRAIYVKQIQKTYTLNISRP